MTTKADIQTGSFSSDGQIYMKVAPSSSFDLNSLAFSSDGQPYWGVGAVVTTYIKFIKVSWENVGKAIGVGSDSVKKLMGVEP